MQTSITTLPAFQPTSTHRHISHFPANRLLTRLRERDIRINDFMDYWERYRAMEDNTPSTYTCGDGMIYVNLETINADSLAKVLNNNIESKAIIFDMRGILSIIRLFSIHLPVFFIQSRGE